MLGDLLQSLFITAWGQVQSGRAHDASVNAYDLRERTWQSQPKVVAASKLKPIQAISAGRCVHMEASPSREECKVDRLHRASAPPLRNSSSCSEGIVYVCVSAMEVRDPVMRL